MKLILDLSIGRHGKPTGTLQIRLCEDDPTKEVRLPWTPELVALADRIASDLLGPGLQRRDSSEAEPREYRALASSSEPLEASPAADPGP